MDVDEHDARRCTDAVLRFERAVGGNLDAIWDALEAVGRASQGRVWPWLAAVARYERRRGEPLATARVYAVADHCRHTIFLKPIPASLRSLGIKPCGPDDRARIASDAFIVLSGMDVDQVVVRNVGGQLTAGLLRIGAAVELRQLSAAGCHVMPELVELAGQLIRTTGLDEAELAARLSLT